MAWASLPKQFAERAHCQLAQMPFAASPPDDQSSYRYAAGPLHTDTMIDHLVDSLQKAFVLVDNAHAQQTV